MPQRMPLFPRKSLGTWHHLKKWFAALPSLGSTEDKTDIGTWSGRTWILQPSTVGAFVLLWISCWFTYLNALLMFSAFQFNYVWEAAALCTLDITIRWLKTKVHNLQSVSEEDTTQEFAVPTSHKVVTRQPHLRIHLFLYFRSLLFDGWHTVLCPLGQSPRPCDTKWPTDKYSMCHSSLRHTQKALPATCRILLSITTKSRWRQTLPYSNW